MVFQEASNLKLCFLLFDYLLRAPLILWTWPYIEYVKFVFTLPPAPPYVLCLAGLSLPVNFVLWQLGFDAKDARQNGVFAVSLIHAIAIHSVVANDDALRKAEDSIEPQPPVETVKVSLMSEPIQQTNNDSIPTDKHPDPPELVPKTDEEEQQAELNPGVRQASIETETPEPIGSPANLTSTFTAPDPSSSSTPQRVGSRATSPENRQATPGLGNEGPELTASDGDIRSSLVGSADPLDERVSQNAPIHNTQTLVPPVTTINTPPIDPPADPVSVTRNIEEPAVHAPQLSHPDDAHEQSTNIAPSTNLDPRDGNDQGSEQAQYPQLSSVPDISVTQNCSQPWHPPTTFDPITRALISLHGDVGTISHKVDVIGRYLEDQSKWPGTQDENGNILVVWDPMDVDTPAVLPYQRPPDVTMYEAFACNSTPSINHYRHAQRVPSPEVDVIMTDCIRQGFQREDQYGGQRSGRGNNQRRNRGDQRGNGRRDDREKNLRGNGESRRQGYGRGDRGAGRGNNRPGRTWNGSYADQETSTTIRDARALQLDWPFVRAWVGAKVHQSRPGSERQSVVRLHDEARRQATIARNRNGGFQASNNTDPDDGDLGQYEDVISFLHKEIGRATRERRNQDSQLYQRFVNVARGRARVIDMEIE